MFGRLPGFGRELGAARAAAWSRGRDAELINAARERIARGEEPYPNSAATNQVARGGQEVREGIQEVL